jgi:hypothetical protein
MNHDGLNECPLGSSLFGVATDSSQDRLDDKIPNQNTEKNFTVRFTVKTIRLGAIDADRYRNARSTSYRRWRAAA